MLRHLIAPLVRVSVKVKCRVRCSVITVRVRVRVRVRRENLTCPIQGSNSVTGFVTLGLVLD